MFHAELGTFQGQLVDIHTAPDATKFYKARAEPFVLRDKIEQELEWLVQEKFIQPVSSSERAAPIVPVVKKNGSIRICGNYKLTANLPISSDR